MVQCGKERGIIVLGSGLFDFKYGEGISQEGMFW